MKRYLAMLMLALLYATSAQAQEEPLLPGLHEAEVDALQPYYSGEGWSIVVDGAYSLVESAQAGDSVSFVVSGSQIVIYRELLSEGSATAEICVDDVCGTFTNASSVDQRSVPIAYIVEDGSTVTITNDAGGILRLDSFLIFAPTPELTDIPAPDPAREYVTLGDGTIAAYDRTLNGGQTVLIAFGAVEIVLLLALVVVSAWRR